MNSNTIGDGILAKGQSLLERVVRNVGALLIRFIHWCEDTTLGAITLSTLKIMWGTFVMFIILICTSGVISILDPSSLFWNKDTASSEMSSDSSGVSGDGVEKKCSVTGIQLHGGVVTYIPYHAEGDTSFNYDVSSSDYITKMIADANEDENVKAIVVEVDSGGGSPVAGEEIATAIKNSQKPVVAYIRDVGASAAYWAVSSAGKLFASKNSNVGSIGVTSSYVSTIEKNKKEGYSYEQLSVGKFKDSGSPDKPLTQDERELFMRDINIIYANFIQVIAENRKVSVEKIKAIADGSTVLGQKAKELGLVDEIGGLPEAEKYLEEKIGEKSIICWK